MKQPLTASPSAALSGRIRVPGDKSISHRALILGALATGITRITGLLEAEDVMATAKAMAALGAGWKVERRGRGERTRGRRLARAVGAARFRQFWHGHPLDARRHRRSRHQVEFTGDASFSRRPMGRVLAPLTAMGLRPTRMRIMRRCRSWCGARLISCPSSTTCRSSAQVKSAVLLAGMHAPGRTTVVEPLASRDHTERMLGYFGAEL